MIREIPQFLRKMYPFERNYVTLNCGHKMHYVSCGSGETVLLLHGHPTWSFFFRNLLLLLKSDFKCVAIDHIGYGMSDKPKRYDYSIATHIANAINFAEIMKFRKFHIVAQDFGATVALAMAERWPERVGSMSILNSAAFMMQNLPGIIMLLKLPIMTFIFAKLFNGLIRMFIHIGTASILDGDVLAGYLLPYKKPSARVAIVEGIHDIPWLPDHPSAEVMKTICDKAFVLTNKKVKFFWADDDFHYGPLVLKEWQRLFPNAKCKHYPLCGHFLLEDSEEAMRDIRTFIYNARNINGDLFR
ncbi:MAG: alpha/beta fold hydrolase [Puniceicoccales bacterium]|jgi:haloalkane dehalogenase|nr:alpha/beta fold hydrolase [Puniceicoccales bacterium]